MAEDENSSDTCENTETTTSALDTEEVIEDAPKISPAVDILHANAPQEAGVNEEQQLFCPPELEDEEDFVVDMAEDCFISGEDAQPSLGMSQPVFQKQRTVFLYYGWAGGEIYKGHPRPPSVQCSAWNILTVLRETLLI
jgi:hypothetical protein